MQWVNNMPAYRDRFRGPLSHDVDRFACVGIEQAKVDMVPHEGTIMLA